MLFYSLDQIDRNSRRGKLTLFFAVVTAPTPENSLLRGYSQGVGSKKKGEDWHKNFLSSCTCRHKL